jgi:hypothetical protein
MYLVYTQSTGANCNIHMYLWENEKKKDLLWVEEITLFYVVYSF